MGGKFEPKRLTDFIQFESREFDICQFKISNYLLSCPRCKSTRVIKRGSRMNKRKGLVKRYSCNDCGYKFSKALPGHLPLSVIADILDLAVKGVAPKDIGDLFNISPQTVMNCIKRFTEFFLNFELKREHKLESREWQVDDTLQKFPKSDRADDENNMSRNVWITDVLAVDSRYWLSAYASHDRKEENTSQAFEMAKQRAKYAPLKVKCDAYKGHIAGIHKVYPFIEIDWKSKKENFGHINLIESLHSFIRRRGVKKRGRFRTIKNLQAFVELLRIYYNFIRLHSALGTTPAAKAGIAPRFSSWGEFIDYVYWHLK